MKQRGTSRRQAHTMSEPGEGLVEVRKGERLRAITGGAKGDTRRSRRRVLGKQQVGKPGTNLQEVALYPLQNLCLDTSRSDTCQTEKP